MYLCTFINGRIMEDEMNLMSMFGNGADLNIDEPFNIDDYLEPDNTDIFRF